MPLNASEVRHSHLHRQATQLDDLTAANTGQPRASGSTVPAVGKCNFLLPPNMSHAGSLAKCTDNVAVKFCECDQQSIRNQALQRECEDALQLTNANHTSDPDSESVIPEGAAWRHSNADHHLACHLCQANAAGSNSLKADLSPSLLNL